MGECKHCKGTGQAPNVITLECVSCQQKVRVTYDKYDSLIAICESVRCADCRAQTEREE